MTEHPRLRPFRVLLLSLLLGFIGSACSQSKPTVSLPALADNAVILAFGDSLTYGTGAQRDQSYPSHLARLTGLQVINAGVPGETTAEGLQRLPQILKVSNPDLVILCLGGNDFLKRWDAQLTRTNLAAMIELLQDRGVPVMLLAVPELGLPLFGELKPAPLYAELARERQLALEAAALPRILAKDALKADRIHPNGEGYRQLAEALRDALRRYGALSGTGVD